MGELQFTLKYGQSETSVMLERRHLDEATEGLAPLMRQEIWRVIRQIKGEGLATVIVDKNITTLLELADHAVILVKGRVVFAGTAAGLRSQPDLLSSHLGV